MTTGDAHDSKTLAFYDNEAASYAARPKPERNRRLEAFLSDLKPGAKIIELGCGGGQDSEAMIRAGFDVTPTDGSVGLAAEAEKRLGRPVRIMRFNELAEQDVYDAVWANACLLHVPAQHLQGVLTKIHTALRNGGHFYASYKIGEGGDRDSLGRYYNFPSRNSLKATYAAAGAWTELSAEEAPGGGYDGVPRTFLHIVMAKA
jgi:SAM-dependent methyltransferase